MTHKSRIPYGKMIDPDDQSRIIECQSEIMAIRSVKEAHASGCSLRAIADFMTETHGPLRGKKWHPEKVKSMLTSEVGSSPLPDES